MATPDGARRWRALSERECYMRLYGHRSGQVERLSEPARAPANEAARHGPTSDLPALHLVFPTVRGRVRMSGEDIRLDLLRRMQARPEAEKPAA